MTNRTTLLYTSYTIATAEEILRRSHYVDIGGVLYVCYALLALACCGACLKLALDVFDRRIPFKKLCVMIAGVVLFAFLILRGQFDVVMIYWLFMCASWDCDFEKLVKLSAITILATLAFVYISSFAGIIDDTVSERMREEVTRNRNGVGFQEAYQAQYFLFFGHLSWFYWRRRKLTLYEIISFIVVAGVIFWQTDTRGPFYLSCALTVIAIVLKLLPQLRKYQKLYTGVNVAMAPFCAALITFQSVFISPNTSEFWRDLNKKLTTRLQLNYSAVREYGFSLLGKPIVWTTGLKEEKYQYNWVDSVYLYSLLSYGIPFILGYFAVTTYLATQASKKKDTFMVIALVLIAILGIWDNYCFRLECNPFYLFLAYAGTQHAEQYQEKLHS